MIEEIFNNYVLLYNFKFNEDLDIKEGSFSIKIEDECIDEMEKIIIHGKIGFDGVKYLYLSEYPVYYPDFIALSLCFKRLHELCSENCIAY